MSRDKKHSQQTASLQEQNGFPDGQFTPQLRASGKPYLKHQMSAFNAKPDLK